MSNINEKNGIQPAVRRELELRDKAMSGDIVINIITSDTAPEPTAAAWTQDIEFELVDSAGNRHDWFTGTIAATASNTSVAGAASVDDATPAVTNGYGTVTLEGDEADWLDTETALCTLNGTVLGYTLANKVFTATFTA